MIKRKIKLLTAVSLSLLVVVVSGLSCFARASHSVQNLLNFYVRQFDPEKALLIIQDKPDETGKSQRGGGGFVVSSSLS